MRRIPLFFFAAVMAVSVPATAQNLGDNWTDQKVCAINAGYFVELATGSGQEAGVPSGVPIPYQAHLLTPDSTQCRIYTQILNDGAAGKGEIAGVP